MKRTRFYVIFLMVFLVATSSYAYERDWTKYPAWIEVTGATKVCAIADVHGAFDELTATLNCLKLATKNSTDEYRFTWTGNDTILVMTGDFNDRGLHSKQVYDAIMDLEKQAEKSGGKIIVTLGNHEAMLLNGQVENWANTLTSHKKKHYQNTLDSFTRDGLDFHQAISEKGVYGQWIRNRPLFAIINGFMFVHGGLPAKPLTRSTLAADFKDDITAGDWKKGVFMNNSGVLWNRDWWKNNQLVEQNLKVLGVLGVVFGHTIGALGEEGSIAQKDSRLVGIDVGMTPAYGNSKGGGLIITTTANGLMVFQAVYPDRPEELLFSVRMPASAYSSGARRNIINR